MPVIVGLRAYAKGGKDELARALIDVAQFERKAFADILRDAVYALNPLISHGHRLRDLVDHAGWDEAKKVPEVRCLLQRGGTEMGRETLGWDVWLNALWPSLQAGKRYVITDVRFRNEAQRIKDNGGEVWQIIRPGYGPVNDHPSETELDGWPFDVVISNTQGIRELHQTALWTLYNHFPDLAHQRAS